MFTDNYENAVLERLKASYFETALLKFDNGMQSRKENKKRFRTLQGPIQIHVKHLKWNFLRK